MIPMKASSQLYLLLTLVAAVLNASLCGGVAADDVPGRMTIDADYPGGNIIVEKVVGNQVHLRQDLRDTNTWWFYWNFRVRGGAGQKFTFQFAGQSPIGVRGPAVSLDGGRSWNWLGDQAVEGSSFEYDFAVGSGEVRFAFTMPYQRQDLERFLASHANALSVNRLQVTTLCQSRKGRDVPLVRLKARSGNARRRVLITARHHACESMASYALEGLLDAWLATPENTRHTMDDVEVVVIPLVDYDGVEEGDQGKNRQPRDHNRDYDGEGIYPETRAIRKLVAGWPSGSVQVAIDLHCPWIRGTHNDVIYMVGSSDRRIAAEQVKLGEILQVGCQGPLPYKLSDNLAFGTAWNTAANFGQGTSFGRWAAGLEGISLATTFEIPYASAGGKPVTAESARAFGQDLAAVVGEYLRRRGD